MAACSGGTSSPHCVAGKTMSVCTTETIQGSHLFHISGYSNNKGVGVGKSSMSGTFHVGGYDWAIRYYPDGERKDCQDCISVYLELVSKNTEATAFFDLRLVDHTTGLSRLVCQQMGTPRVFQNRDSPAARSWGLRKFMKRSELEASPYIADDRLIIECTVRVVKASKVSHTKTMSAIEVPPSNIGEHLGKLLKEEDGADVTFCVDGATFAAHRMMLATRSPVFKAELYGPMREKDLSCITINDMQPEVFKALLHFIYTDSLPIIDCIDRDDNKEMIRHLLVAADRYAIERLKLLCQCILSKNLDVETVATTFALADQHQCDKLRDVCVGFIVSSGRKKDVLASKGYKQLKRSCPSVIAELCERMALVLET